MAKFVESSIVSICFCIKEDKFGSKLLTNSEIAFFAKLYFFPFIQDSRYEHLNGFSLTKIIYFNAR